jgi:hypothetical protein
MKLRSLIPLVALLACFGGCEAGQLKETSSRGDVILKALDRYKADNGDYPTNLKDLCPKYLNEIPAPTWGLRTWVYDQPSSSHRGYPYLKVNEDEHTGDGNSHWFQYLGPQWGWQRGD